MKKVIFLAICCLPLCVLGQGGEIQLANCSAICVENIDSMKAINPTSLAGVVYVNVAGYYSSNDGGGGIFKWMPGSTLPNDNGYIISPNVTTAGRFVRMKKGRINLKEFGSSPPASTSRTDNNAFNDAISYCMNSSLPSADLFLPAGLYKFSIDYGYNIRLRLYADAGAIVTPTAGADYIFKFTTNHFLNHEINDVFFDGNVGGTNFPTGNETGVPSAIKIYFDNSTANNGVEMRINKCRFDDLNGCDFVNCRETYIDNSNFNGCSKAFILKNATETRMENCNIRSCGYGIYAVGDFSLISNGFHAGIYFDQSFILGCTNYPIYCTYLDFASITSSMIDLNDKPSYFKSLDQGNITGNFMGTRISNGINDNGKALIITGSSVWPVTNWDDRSHNISISNNRFLCHSQDGAGNNSSNIDAVLIENSDYVDFSHNHVYLFNRYGVVTTNCTSLKLNDNVITRNTNSSVASPKSIYGAASTGGGNNFACNNYLDLSPGDFQLPANNSLVVTTDKQLQNIINKGGNTFGGPINIGALDDNPVSIISNGIATLNVGKDYLVANSSLRMADGKYIQFLSNAGGLSSVLGVTGGSGGSLLIGDLFNGQAPTSGPVIFRSGGNDRLKIDTKVQIKRAGDVQWNDVAVDDGLLIKQNGNTLGSAVSIGAKDNFPVNIISNNSTVLSVSATGSSVNSNFRILGANFLQLSSFDNSNLASVMGIQSGTSNLLIGNIFGQLLNGGNIIFKGTSLNTPLVPADVLRINSTVERQLAGGWYNVAVDNFFIASAPSTASLSIDFANFNVRTIQLAVANTSLSYTNLRKGRYTIIIKQDATGGRTITFPSSAPPLNITTYTKGAIDTAPNAYSVMNIDFDGSSNVFVNITPAWTKIL